MDITQFNNDNSKNHVLESKVPKPTTKDPCMLGIDEAGRGPVLGPMVYAAAYCPVSSLEALKEKGFADSKTLTEEQREKLFEVINEADDMIGWVVEIHSPNVISNNMLKRNKYNLNAISHDSAILLIRKALSFGVNLTEVYVDTVGPPDKYQSKLSTLFPDIKITVAKQADSTYPIVSAASICAKVARDNILKSWKFAEGDDFSENNYGSGYPNDPVTKKFLTERLDPIFGFPQIVRFSWSTADKILQDKAVKVTWEDDEDGDGCDAKISPLAMFMKKRKREPKEKKPKSDAFFTRRHLTQAVEMW